MPRTRRVETRQTQNMTRAEREARVADLRRWFDAQHEEFRGDAFPPGLQATWDDNTAELREHEDALAELEARDARLQEIARSGEQGSREAGSWEPAAVSRWGAQPLFRGDPWQASVPGLGSPGRPVELRARAITAVERCVGGMSDAAREYGIRALERDDDELGRLATFTIETSRAEYVSAFASWLRDPVSGHREWSGAEVDAVRRVRSLERAMALGTGAAGGFLLPYQLDPNIVISAAGSVDPMRSVSRVETTVLNEARFVTSAGVTASWDAEAVEVSDDSPTLAQPSITAFKGQAWVPVSFEVFEDSDISQQVGALFADAKAQLESNAFTLGTGTGQPKGVITAVSAVGGSVVTSAGSALTPADATANQNALPARWRPRARWMANLSVINQGRTTPLYTNGPAMVSDATTPPRMLGWEVVENSAMDGTIAAGTTNDYVLLSGDFSNYIVVDRLGVSLDFVPVLVGANQRPTGQRGFLMHWRAGGDVVVGDAFRLTNYSA